MVALSKIFLLGTAFVVACAQAATTTTKAASKPTTTTKAASKPTPSHSPKQMSQVVDCQAQCIELVPAFGNKPDHNVRKFMRRDDHGRMKYLINNMKPIVNPCLNNLRKLKGNYKKVTEENFQNYVLCNSKTLTKNEDVYFSKKFDYKKNGFSKQEWTVFRNQTLPSFRAALHRCRGGCRRIHF